MGRGIKNILKGILSLLLIAAMALGMVPVPFVEEHMVVHATPVDFGTCGTNLTWTLDDSGVLTISGTGAMTDYDSSVNVP